MCAQYLAADPRAIQVQLPAIRREPVHHLRLGTLTKQMPTPSPRLQPATLQGKPWGIW